jgi:serine/threonine protein kinase
MSTTRTRADEILTGATEAVCSQESVIGSAPQYAIGSSIGKYHVTGFLGKGGMGEVYKGHDPLIDRAVALKVLPASLASNNQAMQRFLSEARAVGRLHHPNTVALYEVGQNGSEYFLAMEFVAGGGVAGLLQEGKGLEWKRATRYFIELAQGLAAAHAVNLIHRDIKPDNLLRTPDDHLKITDFGLAKVNDELNNPTLHLTKPGDLLGTPFYMSPEQFGIGLLDHRTDLYSAGCTYYHLLTGQRPYENAKTLAQVMFAHCNSEIPDPRAIDPAIPEACFTVLKKATAKKPDDRYADANALVADLKKIIDKPDANRPMVFWLIEPSKVQASILSSHLKALGVHEVRTFATIAAAQEAFVGGLPSAAISAMHLDDGTGDDFANRLREVPKGDAVYCFLISSDPNQVSSNSYYPGRPLVLIKPITKDVLSHIVARVASGIGVSP